MANCLTASDVGQFGPSDCNLPRFKQAGQYAQESKYYADKSEAIYNELANNYNLNQLVQQAKDSAMAAKVSEIAAADSASLAKADADKVDAWVQDLSTADLVYISPLGGETTLQIPATFTNVRTLYINGSRQTLGDTFSFDPATHIVSFLGGNSLQAGDKVIVVSSTIYEQTSTVAQTLQSPGGADYVKTGDGESVQQKLDYLNSISKVSILKFSDKVPNKGDPIEDWDWTEAIEAAHEYITNPALLRYPAAVGDPAYLATKGPVLEFPAGVYNYNGSGLNLTTNQSFILQWIGHGSQNTRINIKSGSYLFDMDYNPVGFDIQGIHFQGGKGAVRFKSISSNNVRFLRFENNVISNYTECGFQHNSQDFPYLKIKSNLFIAAKDEQTIGVAISGYSAGSTISDNAFQNNRYQLKLSTKEIAGSGNDRGPAVPINIHTNDFFRNYARVDDSYAIWLVPNTETSNNAGRGIVFAFNKMGNENLGINDAHVLVAREDVGNYVGDKHHSTTLLSGYINGVCFIKNNINSSNKIPFIKTFTGLLSNWSVNDIYDNGNPSIFCSYDSQVTSFDLHSTSNIVTLEQDIAGEKLTEFVLTNVPGTWVCHDPLGYAFGNEGITPYYTGGDGQAGFVDLLGAIDTSTMAKLGSAPPTSSALNNAIGEVNEAMQVTFNAPTVDGSRLAATLSASSLIAGQPVWIDFDLKKGSINPADNIMIQVVSGQTVLYRRLLTTPSNWSKCRFRWTPITTQTDLAFHVYCPSQDSTHSTVALGRMRIYHSQEPTASGYLQARNSAWNRSHLILGNYHLWVDATGALRIKNGAPTSATDGATV